MIKTSPQRRQTPSSPPRRSGAANDNRRLRVIVPTSPRRLARHGANVLKLNPYIRLLGDALDVLEMLQQFQAPGWDGLGSWTKYGSCPSPSPLYYGPWVKGVHSTLANSSTIRNGANSCQAGQNTSPGVTTGDQTPGDPWAYVPTNARSVGIGRLNPLTERMQYHEAYTRPSSGAFEKPVYREPRAAIALPPSVPATWPLSPFPELAPPFAAPAFPAPRPWRMPAGIRSPNSAVSYGDVSSGAVAPSGKPSQVPNDWSVSLELGPSVRGAPSTHTMAPPSGAGTASRDRVKEAKVKISPAFAFVLKAVGMSTEGLDILNAIYQALPSEYRPKFRGTDHELRSATVFQKMQALFENADKIVISQAIENLIYEQAEDAVYGKIGKVGGEISQRLGINYGAGMNSISSRLRKLTYDRERDELDSE